MIQFGCPCGKQLQAREEQVGQQAACPSCGATLTVPGDAQAIRPPAAPTAPSTPTPSEYAAAPPPADPVPGPQLFPRERAPAPTLCGKALASLILGALTFCLPVLPAIPAIILGILALLDINRSGGRLTGKGLAIGGLVTGSLGNLAVLLALWGVQNVRTAAMRTQSQHNLKIIGLAMHNYHDANKSFPAAAIYSKDGKTPLLSWRVALLPYFEQFPLYKEFKLDEPWDSPHNIRLLSHMPAEYASPRGETPPHHTHYLVFTGPKTPFNGPFGPNIHVTFRDGTPNTFLVAEADDAVPWTKPADLEVAPERPLPRLGGLFGNRFNALFADGSVRFLDLRRVNEPTLRLLIDPNDGQPIPADVLD